jgi:ATP-dependent Zn protease
MLDYVLNTIHTEQTDIDVVVDVDDYYCGDNYINNNDNNYYNNINNDNNYNNNDNNNDNVNNNNNNNNNENSSINSSNKDEIFFIENGICHGMAIWVFYFFLLFLFFLLFKFSFTYFNLSKFCLQINVTIIKNLMLK